MKYEERLLQVRASIADTQRMDEERRRAQEEHRPGRARNVFLGGGPHLFWKIPVLIALITVFVLYPHTIIREVNRYVHVPNWALNLIPGYGYGNSPFGFAAMGLAGLAIIVGGLGFYVWIRRAQNPTVRW